MDLQLFYERAWNLMSSRQKKQHPKQTHNAPSTSNLEYENGSLGADLKAGMKDELLQKLQHASNGKLQTENEDAKARKKRRRPPAQPAMKPKKSPRDAFSDEASPPIDTTIPGNVSPPQSLMPNRLQPTDTIASADGRISKKKARPLVAIMADICTQLGLDKSLTILEQLNAARATIGISTSSSTSLLQQAHEVAQVLGVTCMAE